MDDNRLRDLRNKLKTGMFNILIAGCSGSGKSTLVNEIFEGDFATTGLGEPVTMETRKYTKKGVPLAIYDTRGLELKKCDEIIKQLLTFVEDIQKQERKEQHIHVAWLCIAEDKARVEEAEKELASGLAQGKPKIPVIAVITKARSANQEFRSEVQRLLPETTQVVRVRAIEEHIDGGYVLPPMGLENLVEATAQVLEGGEILRTFAMVQRSRRLKEQEAKKAVMAAVVSAGGAGAIPIPLASEGLLVPIQVMMLVHISRIFGVNETSAEFWRNLTAGLVASLAGGTMVIVGLGNLLKFIPGVGTLLGGAILSSSCSFLTHQLGKWYIDFLLNQFDSSGGGVPSLEAIKQGFKEFSEIQKRNFKVVETKT
ncbi:MAG: GTP-binding protein [Synechococcus sp. SB0677_bin_5]|nr:GTP-binding protein [Synechococcus sp. SB0677_bin_5]